MVEECTYERIPQDQVAPILDNVIEFRTSYDQYEKPDDVNSLMCLFPSVHLRDGYVLDYEIVHEGEAITRIRPFARSAEGEELLLVDDTQPPELEGHSDQDVETLYQYLDYER